MISHEYLFQCMNPDCFEGTNIGFVFSSKLPICPKCNSRPPHVATAVRMHFIYRDKTGNLLGYLNRKYKVACGMQLQISPYEGMSDVMDVVNCPQCVKSDIYKAAWSPDPRDPLSYFRDPNLTDEDIEQLLKGNENGGTP